MKQFLVFVRKEFLHVFRDRKTLLLLFGLPVVQIVLFGFALTNEIKNSKIVICDFANDESSRRLAIKFEASTNFEIEKNVHSIQELENVFRDGKIKLAVVIPGKFENDLNHQHHAQIQLIADASDPNTATTLTNFASNIITNFQQEQGRSDVNFAIIPEVRMLYNPELKGATNFVPGVMALVLLLVCVLMTSVSIVKEKENGTMEILLVSPFQPILVIVSKLTPYFVLSLINLAVILSLSTFLLDTPIKGSILLLVLESCLFIITALSLGLMISNVTDSQQNAMFFSLVGMLMPTVLLSGFMFPLENMPWPLQVVSNIVPSKWYYIIVRDVMIKGVGFHAIWKETIILAGMTTILMVISLKRFKIRLV
jgi:ABC-2 type transport system permease protein